MSADIVNIKHEVLKWILEKSQYYGYIDALNKIQSWLSREKQPTFRQIEEVSSKMRIPLGVFFLDISIKEEFRFADLVL